MQVPAVTAAVSVETGPAAKAGHWETEKVGEGRRSICSIYASQKTDYEGSKYARNGAIIGEQHTQE